MSEKIVLIIGFVWPEPNSSAAGTRMMQLIASFQKQNWEVVFASAAATSTYMFDIGAIGVKKVTVAVNDSGFDAFISDLLPDIVVFDRFIIEEQFGWRVAENAPNALRILETVDLHTLRLARQKAFKEERTTTTADLFSDIAKREIASILRSDMSLLISEEEIEVLHTAFNIAKNLLYYLPFMVDALAEKTVASWPKYEERKDFIFIGNFLHEPNWNAVQYLKETIWPLLQKKLPEASLLIYGAYPSQKVLQLHDVAARFLVLGRVDNAARVVKKARIVLAPLRFGAGAKGKLIEAMQCGTPSITTAIGAEGMAGNLPWNGTIANKDIEIAAAALALYQDKESWNKAQQNGIKIINERYNKSLFETAFIARILAVTAALTQHRKNNFFGSMLLHHTAASSKYMSRWIEAKNQHTGKK